MTISMTTSPITRRDNDGAQGRQMLGFIRHLTHNSNALASLGKKLNEIWRLLLQVRDALHNWQLAHQGWVTGQSDDNQVILDKLNALEQGQVDLMKLLAYQKDEEI